MRRVLWTLALLGVGDGVVTAAMPHRHVARWAQGPQWFRRMMRPLATHPEAARALGLVEASLALWWTRHMSDRPSLEPDGLPASD